MDQNQDKDATLDEKLRQAEFSLQESERRLYGSFARAEFSFAQGCIGFGCGALVDLPLYLYNHSDTTAIVLSGLGLCLGLIYGASSFPKFREDFREKAMTKYTSLLEKVFE